MKTNRVLILLSMIIMIAVVIGGCSDSSGSAATSDADKVLVVGAIPDQNISDLTRRFDLFADYLGEKTGLEVKYAPSVDYAALVTAFKRGEIQLAWFGGLTGVQARELVPGSDAIAQRPRDSQFHSVFIAQSGLNVKSLKNLTGLSFTFGSESSTSGHLMPRYFLLQEGINAETDFEGMPNFSGSHDKTWKLVESGAYQAGALNEAVWQAALAEGKVDTDKVEMFYTTPPYFDYNWTIHADVGEMFGPGTKDKITDALLSMGQEQKEILALFAADSFVETNNENYQAIEQVAAELGIIK
ncbi:putative selenate ABC transporter substrate-binding protein [Metallumcola ferriviriculae]|uniref:Selenate ABC transporter substrate-binding protein n=2 Tax=Metallumcola ferriviriculae TaxID=3039180 RepID=A0AAU0UQJ0_9FIRM|nr:putative selenate ABC transporter substrate-binding protein [Desulfitibacteraceae bacterium MK1]